MTDPSASGDGTYHDDGPVTDAHMILKVYSGRPHRPRDGRSAGGAADAIRDEGRAAGPESPEDGAPSHGYFFLTRHLIGGLEINEQVAAFGTAFGDTRRLNAFCARDDVRAEVTVYHWTTDGSVFRFLRQSLSIFAALEFPVWFHVVQYPD